MNALVTKKDIEKFLINKFSGHCSVFFENDTVVLHIYSGGHISSIQKELNEKLPIGTKLQIKYVKEPKKAPRRYRFIMAN